LQALGEAVIRRDFDQMMVNEVSLPQTLSGIGSLR